MSTMSSNGSTKRHLVEHQQRGREYRWAAEYGATTNLKWRSEVWRGRN